MDLKKFLAIKSNTFYSELIFAQAPKYLGIFTKVMYGKNYWIFQSIREQLWILCKNIDLEQISTYLSPRISDLPPALLQHNHDILDHKWQNQCYIVVFFLCLFKWLQCFFTYNCLNASQYMCFGVTSFVELELAELKHSRYFI